MIIIRGLLSPNIFNHQNCGYNGYLLSLVVVEDQNEVPSENRTHNVLLNLLVNHYTILGA